MDKKRLIILLVVFSLPIDLLGAYFVFRSITKKTPPPATKLSGKGGKFTVIKGKKGGRISIEAEDFVEIKAPFSLPKEDDPVAATASGKKCVYLGPEKVNETPELRKVSIIYGSLGAVHPGYLRYRFTATESGRYALWLRAFWVDDCGDSIAVTFRDLANPELTKAMPLQKISGTNYGRWTWNPLNTGEGTPLWLTLKSGNSYELIFCNREDDLYLDQILLRKGDRQWPDPIGSEPPSKK